MKEPLQSSCQSVQLAIYVNLERLSPQVPTLRWHHGDTEVDIGGAKQTFSSAPLSHIRDISFRDNNQHRLDMSISDLLLAIYLS